MRITSLFFIFLTSCLGFAQAPQQFNSAEILHNIKKLNVLGNVLYLAAHPDDENTRFISYCANDKLFNTAYLSLTRGDGGQNLIGTEIREALGIVRTQELLAARRTDGGKQFFTRANDFGYSKNPEETFKIWDKDKIMSDVVWVIRSFRPDIIVCRFPTDGGGGHGHHTASAILAKEAFDLAADSNAFPEQLKYVSVWQPIRVVVNTGRWWNPDISADDSGVVALDVGKYNSLLGASYTEIASKSRSKHKSQGFGSTGIRGEHLEYFEHLVGKQARNSLFDDMVTDWSRVNENSLFKKDVDKLIEEFDPTNPALSVNTLNNLFWMAHQSKNEWLKSKEENIKLLMMQCLGFYVEASTDAFSKSSGDSLTVQLEVISRRIAMPYGTRGMEAVLMEDEDNSILIKGFEPNVNSFYTHHIKVPELPISQPYWLKEKPSLGTYVVDDQLDIGKPENSASLNYKISIMVNKTPIEIEIPVVYKWNDPVKGEQYRPFVITPKTTANINQPIYLFPDRSAKQIDVIIKSHSDDQEGEVMIKAPYGWELTYDRHFNLKHKGDELKIAVEVFPGEGAVNGSLEVFINKQKAKAISTVKYDHFPNQVWFPESSAKLVFVDLKKEKKKIGYVEGAGDLVPDALRTIGYTVDILKEGDLDLENLKQYDAILTGIRFFNVNERSPFMVKKLLAYAENGGNLIVQYNTRHRMKTQDFGPYPILLSRDRVTDEESAVDFIARKHKVLNQPNKITKADFEGWVQERGLYFPSEWSNEYTAILKWNDEGEDSKTGALLVAPYGKGNYIYTGISFFRELPAGVPGAFRLLVNLIELKHD